jgi:hypothetical protein
MALLLVAACSSPARAPLGHQSATTRLSLQPIKLFGGEGRHSARHASSLVRGALELRGESATLVLDVDQEVSHVRCPPELVGKTMQQCADNSMRDARTQSKLTLRGEVRFADSGFSGRLTNGDRQLALTCRETVVGYACELGDQTVWGPIGDRPARLVFVRPAAHRHYDLAPARLPDPSGDVDVDGTLVMGEDTATLALAINGGQRATFVLPLFWAPAGVVMQGRGVSLICTDADDKLACDLGADPGVFARPAFTGPVSFVARK